MCESVGVESEDSPLAMAASAGSTLSLYLGTPMLFNKDRIRSWLWLRGHLKRQEDWVEVSECARECFGMGVGEVDGVKRNTHRLSVMVTSRRS